MGTQLGTAADAGQDPEVAEVVLVEAQRLAQRGEHLGRRVGVAALLDPDQVVDAYTGQRGQLGPAQAGRAPTRALAQADLGWRQRPVR